MMEMSPTPSISDRGDDGAGKSMLKDRWWPLPGVLAVVGTLVLVGIAQGWVRSSQVVLPQSVQIGAPPAPAKTTTTTTASTVPPEDGIVVAAARPVLGETTGTSPVARGSVPAAAPSATPGQAADP